MTLEIWPYAPQKGMVESVEWYTDVQRCRSAEYRRSLRTKPRQELQLSHKMTAEQFGEAKLMAKDIGIDPLLVPLWPWAHVAGALAEDANQVPKDIGDPIALHAEGTDVLIWDHADKWEMATVDTNITDPENPRIQLESGLSQAYTNALVIPLRTGQFAQEFEATSSSSRFIEASARFQIPVGDDFGGCWNTQYHAQQELGLYQGETYRTFPVVTYRSLAVSGVREQFERRFEELDSAIGLAYRFPTLSAPEQSGSITWAGSTRATSRPLLYWLHSRRGMYKSFWVPSWNADLTVTAEIAAADTTVQIADVNFRTRAAFPCDIMILTTAGARIYKRVNSAAAGTAGNEVLTLSAAAGAHLYTWDISAVCMMHLSRFAADRTEITHQASGHVVATAQIVEVPA